MRSKKSALQDLKCPCCMTFADMFQQRHGKVNFIPLGSHPLGKASKPGEMWCLKTPWGGGCGVHRVPPLPPLPVSRKCLILGCWTLGCSQRPPAPTRVVSRPGGRCPCLHTCVRACTCYSECLGVCAQTTLRVLSRSHTQRHYLKNSQGIPQGFSELENRKVFFFFCITVCKDPRSAHCSRIREIPLGFPLPVSVGILYMQGKSIRPLDAALSKIDFSECF